MDQHHFLQTLQPKLKEWIFIDFLFKPITESHPRQRPRGHDVGCSCSAAAVSAAPAAVLLSPSLAVLAVPADPRTPRPITDDDQSVVGDGAAL